MVQFFYANCFIVTPQNTCRYAQYVERCCVFHVCVKNCTQTTQNHADALRNFAPLREKHMLFCQESFHTELTEIHRICSAFFWDISTKEHILFSHRTHGLTQNLLRRFLDIRTQEHILFSDRIHGNTQNLRHMLLRKSAPSAWDNSTPHGSLLPTTSSLLTDIAPQGISANSCH